MTNREKFSKEILDVACSGHAFAVDERNGNPVPCSSVGCKSCLFYRGIVQSCGENGAIQNTKKNQK